MIEVNVNDVFFIFFLGHHHVAVGDLALVVEVGLDPAGEIAPDLVGGKLNKKLDSIHKFRLYLNEEYVNDSIFLNF